MKKLVTMIMLGVLTVGFVIITKPSKALENPLRSCTWSFKEISVSQDGIPQNPFLSGSARATCSSGVTYQCEPLSVTLSFVDMATLQGYEDNDTYTSVCGKSFTIYMPMQVPRNKNYMYTFRGVGVNTGINYFSLSGFLYFP